MSITDSLWALYARWRGPIEFLRGIQAFLGALLFSAFWAAQRGHVRLPQLWMDVSGTVLDAFEGQMWLFYLCIVMSISMGVRRWRRAAGAGVRT